MSHTPGPWQVDGNGALIVTPTDKIIASLSRTKNGKANAKLIAAAPDMFRVLKRLLAFSKLTKEERLMIEDCLDGAGSES